ncbi:HK97 family phage prohead protease [Arcanobacterium hippocoleae]
MKTRNRQINNLEIRETNGAKGWEFDALAVPWETIDNIGGGVFEQFERGSLSPVPQGVKLRLEHAETIGLITDCRNEEDGLYITARISDTAAGRDARTLLLDGALTGLSVGFNQCKPAKQEERDGKTVFTQTAGELLEVSLVSFPAYRETNIQEIRTNQEKDNAMSTKTIADIDELRTSISEISRELTAIKENTSGDNSHPLAQFRSAGDFMKAYAANKLNARDFADDATLVNNLTVKPGWFDRELKLMQAKQPVTNIFTHAADLPREGMSFDYPIIGTNTIQIAEQEKEGDTLVHGKITLDSGNVKVKTFGGYAPLSRQAIDRASATYLSTIWKAQGIQYATAIESETRSVLVDTITNNLKSTSIDSTLTATTLTVDEILSLTLEIIDHFDDEVLWPFTGIAVSADVFAYLTTLGEDKKLSSLPAHLPIKLAIFRFPRVRVKSKACKSCGSRLKQVQGISSGIQVKQS